MFVLRRSVTHPLPLSSFFTQVNTDVGPDPPPPGGAGGAATSECVAHLKPKCTCLQSVLPTLTAAPRRLVCIDSHLKPLKILIQRARANYEPCIGERVPLPLATLLRACLAVDPCIRPSAAGARVALAELFPAAGSWPRGAAALIGEPPSPAKLPSSHALRTA